MELIRLGKLPPQWINCDLRKFDYSVLGKFHVIMADPMGHSYECVWFKKSLYAVISGNSNSHPT